MPELGNLLKLESMGRSESNRIFTDAERMLVKFMAIAAVPQERIAKVLKLRKETLLKEFRAELDEGADQLNANVVGALYKNAVTGNVAAQIFWCKTRLGWKDTSALEVSGKLDHELIAGPRQETLIEWEQRYKKTIEMNPTIIQQKLEAEGEE